MSSSAASADAERRAAVTGVDDAPGDAAGAEPLRVVCGPTAAGKSALALRLAECFGAAILSADSRQLYRGFDIGTAKPDAAEQARVPHYGIDVAGPTERYSAARWAGEAEGWLADARRRGLVPLVAGGTGFYVRALVEPLFAAPALDEERRARLAAVLEPLDTAALRRWTAVLDPARAHLGRTQLLRAVETALLTGRRISELHAAAPAAARRPARYLVVDPGRDALRERVERRVDAMLGAGWVDEVRALATWVPAEAPAWNAAGYDAVRAHAAGAIDLAEARRRTIVATRRYAKRQRTWIRHQLAGDDVTHLDPRLPDAFDRAAAWWRGERVPPPVEIDP